LVVDAFFEMHHELNKAADSMPEDTTPLNARLLHLTSSPKDEVSDLIIDYLPIDSNRMPRLPYSPRVVSEYLARALTGSLVVLYRVNDKTLTLDVSHACGRGASLIKNVRIPISYRIYGWVAANSQTIFDADPALDNVPENKGSLTFATCSSLPLGKDQVLAVLTIYSAVDDSYNESRQRVLSTVVITSLVFQYDLDSAISS